MEANFCDVDHLDSEVLLPPRKRLLAGLKKHNPDADAAARSSLLDTSSGDVDARLNKLLRSHVNNPNFSPEEIVEVSRSAVVAAATAAEGARAAKAMAEDKAAIAVKAIAAAKTALGLVASLSEETAGIEMSLKKTRQKRHVPVQLLYKKHQLTENNRVDEELALKLHHAINSFPRICKNFSTSSIRSLKNKKLKSLTTSEEQRIPNGGKLLEEGPYSMCSGHAVASGVDFASSNQKSYRNDPSGKASQYYKAGELEMGTSEAETSHLKDKTSGDTCMTGKKRGRVKLKKLPLSICSFRDQAKHKVETNSRSLPLAERNSSSLSTGNVSLFSLEPADGYDAS